MIVDRPICGFKSYSGKDCRLTMSSSGVNMLSASAFCIARRNVAVLSTCSRHPYAENSSKLLHSGFACTTSFTFNSFQPSTLHLNRNQFSRRQKFCRRASGAQTPQRRHASELYIVTAGFKKKLKKAMKNLDISSQDGNLPELQDELPQLAISLPLGLASFEALFLVGWVSSLRGLLPGARLFFSAADLILCSVMFANCVVGWYALEHSCSEIKDLPREKWSSKLRVAQPGLLEIGSSIALGLIPFANLFLWLRFARRQDHLSPKAKAAIVANAWVYAGPPLFTILLMLNGGWSLFLQVGLVSNVAMILGALHRPFEEARIKNEKVLMEVAKAKGLGGKKGKDEKVELKEITAEERERIDRLKELEEFDILLAQGSPRDTAILSGRPEDWSVGETMQWLAQQGLARYANTFAENNIDGMLLLQLSNNDLRDELGIQSLGDRRKLDVLIQQLRRDGYR